VTSPRLIQRFASDLLTHLGATVMTDGPNRVAVAVPPELAARFQHREALNFAFSSEAVLNGGGTELVIPGSHWLDRLLEFAVERGQVGAVRLAPHPSAERPDSSPPEGIVFPDAVPRVRSGVVLDSPFLLVQFKLTFVSDDIEELLWPVWVDLVSGVVTDGPEGFTWASITDGSDAEDLHQRNEAQITMDSALALSRTAAESEAARRAEEKDKEIEHRLQDELVRLDEFYGDLLQDLEKLEESSQRSKREDHSDFGAERTRLKEEKQRRQQEALDKFQLKVVVRPINAAHCLAPVWVQEVEVSNGISAGTISVHYDLTRGTVRHPPCPDCGEPTGAVHLCRRGHLVCPSCAETCVHCQQVFCTSCRIFPCPLCGRHTCPDCSGSCTVCGEVSCREHLLNCEDTGLLTCSQCATDCPACRRRYREAPLRRCAQGEEKVCSSCLTQCVHCGSSVCPDHIFQCAVCDKPACTTDRATCTECLQPYCSSCCPAEEKCPTCRSLFPVRQAETDIISVLTSAGVDAVHLSHWQLAEDLAHFLVVGRRWWWRHLFVLDKATMGLVARRRHFRLFRNR